MVGAEDGPVGGGNVVFWSVRFDIDENPDELDADEQDESEIEAQAEDIKKIDISEDVD